MVQLNKRTLTMNLKFHLLSRIVLIALLCFLSATAYVLYSTDRQSQQEARLTADSLDKQLEFQLLRINAGFGRPGYFPDLDLWRSFNPVPGTCIRFLSVDRQPVRSVCSGEAMMVQSWPDGFAGLYRWLFNPGSEISRPVTFNNRFYGSINVAPSAQMQVARAWASISGMMGLSAMTILAVCLLVYAAITRALSPARLIVAGLDKMQHGDLSYRLPTFELIEWQQTAAAINQLATGQEQLLSERRRLVLKLMAIQEQERRYLARELHDEFGQCLAAINAVAASIVQTAGSDCPALIPEAQHISEITRHMLETVRGLLLRLRPSDIDELGLSASLNGLVMGWNARGGGNIHYQLDIAGDCERLTEPLPVTIFRIVQECLSNIAKHSDATEAKVTLVTTAEAVELTIEDNGIADKLPFAGHSGIGLFGIRERATALGGRLQLQTADPHGLIVRVALPVAAVSED